jgi:hypothetical protein
VKYLKRKAIIFQLKPDLKKRLKIAMTALNFSVDPALVGKDVASTMMSSITLSTSINKANNT